METLKDNETAESGGYTKQRCVKCKDSVRIDFMAFIMGLDETENILCDKCKANQHPSPA